MSYLNDLSLPPIGGPTRVRLRDGRLATIRVTIDDAPAPDEALQVTAPAPDEALQVTAPAPDEALQVTAPAPPELVAPLEGNAGAGVTAVPLPPAPPPAPDRPPADDPVFDDVILGGRLTVFMLLYGDYADMHRRALSSLLGTLPPGRAEVRLASNRLGAASAEYVAGLVAAGRVAGHVAHAENRRKYPVMRELFRDPAWPIATPYVVWLDDDTICDVNRDWFSVLARTIVAEHPRGARLFGPHYIYTPEPEQRAWIEAAPWYRGVPYVDRAGRQVEGADKVHFASGSLWALATHAIHEQDIPDARLAHNGGDWTIGAQVMQGGWKLCGFSNNKGVVRWSAYGRRGLSEPHPGRPGWLPASSVAPDA